MILRRSLNLAAVAALVSVGVAVVVLGSASAHSPYVATSCDAGAAQGETSLKDYHGENHVQIWVDGVSVVDATFNRSYHNLSDLGDPSVAHTYRVRVVAQDDEDFKDGWSVDDTKESHDCEPESTSSTHPHDQVKICEETTKGDNPPMAISVDQNSVLTMNGHDGHADDIIPPFPGYPGKNWDQKHREAYDNDCHDVDHGTTTTSSPESSVPDSSEPEDSVPYTTAPTTTVPVTTVPATTVPAATTTTQDSGTPVTTAPASTTTEAATTTTIRQSGGPTTSAPPTTTTTPKSGLPTSGGTPGPTMVLGALGLLIGLGMTLFARRRRQASAVAE
jgi:hypothetical protein